jgi:hypothetical protein
MNTLYVKGFYLADENGNACPEFPVIVGRDQFVEMHTKSDGSVVLVTKLQTRLNVLPGPHNESITYQWTMTRWHRSVILYPIRMSNP